MVKEGHQQNTKLLINVNTAQTPTGVSNRSSGWYIGWFILGLITVAAQIIITIYVVLDLVYIFKNISSWPIYSHDKIAHGIIAIGHEAYGIIAIGQISHGVICIGQITYGIFSIGQVGLGILFTFCQIGGGLGIAIGQMVVATKILYAQIGFAAWKVNIAQLGFNIGSSIIAGTKLVTTCKCGYKKYNVITDNDNIKCGVNGIMNGIRYPRYWPKKAKQEFAITLHKYDIEKVIESMVYESAKGKYHGLHKLNDDELKEVIAHLLDLKDEFQEIAMKNFPLQSNQFPL